MMRKHYMMQALYDASTVQQHIPNEIPMNTYPQWARAGVSVKVEDVEHEHFEGIGGDEAVVGSQQPAFVVTPCLDLKQHTVKLLAVRKHIFLHKSQTNHTRYAPR